MAERPSHEPVRGAGRARHRGGRGIGQAIARRLASEGARVFTAQRGPDGGFEAIAADFADAGAPARAVAEVVDRAGRLDVLVNNAGVMQEALVEEMALADWERTIRVNLTAPFLAIRAALPHLRAVRGAIVNVGSIEGRGRTRAMPPTAPRRRGCTG